jgi:hypothetical protein
MKDKHIAVWFSCGAASAVAAKLTLEKYGNDNKISIVNNPIKEEHEDNQRFLKDVEKWLGHEITFATSQKYPNQSCQDVWDDRKYMSGVGGAPCTMELKKRARQEWEEVFKPDYTVLGFTSEETQRADRFRLTERDTLLTPLIDFGYNKQMCFVFDQRAKTSREIGCKLTYHKGDRMYLDELPVDAKGRKLKDYDFECGIFCEEK